MSNELRSFVKESLEKGLKKEEISRVLHSAGWEEKEVKSTLSAFSDVDFPVPVPRPKPYLQAREAFIYLISFITLYITAFSFGALIFSFIDRLFPDPLRFFGDGSVDGMRRSVAAIIVAFPLYLFLMWNISKKGLEQQQSKIRKWLSYITLVIAAAIIIGDLITIITGLLGGELTVRFILKALTILVITGSIFGYYLWDLRKEEK